MLWAWGWVYFSACRHPIFTILHHTWHSSATYFPNNSFPALSPYSWNRKFWWGGFSNGGFLFFWPPLLQGGFDECLGSTCGPWSSGWEPLAYTQIFSYVNPSIFNWIKLKSSKMEEWTKYAFKIAWSTVIKLLSWWNGFTVNFVQPDVIIFIGQLGQYDFREM